MFQVIVIRYSRLNIELISACSQLESLILHGKGLMDFSPEITFPNLFELHAIAKEDEFYLNLKVKFIENNPQIKIVKLRSNERSVHPMLIN